MSEVRRYIAVVQDARGYRAPGSPLEPAPPEGPAEPVIHTVVLADDYEALLRRWERCCDLGTAVTRTAQDFLDDCDDEPDDDELARKALEVAVEAFLTDEIRLEGLDGTQARHEWAKRTARAEYLREYGPEVTLRLRHREHPGAFADRRWAFLAGCGTLTMGDVKAWAREILPDEPLSGSKPSDTTPVMVSVVDQDVSATRKIEALKDKCIRRDEALSHMGGALEAAAEKFTDLGLPVYAAACREAAGPTDLLLEQSNKEDA